MYQRVSNARGEECMCVSGPEAVSQILPVVVAKKHVCKNHDLVVKIVVIAAIVSAVVG